MGINSAKKWDRLETFGGKLTENIVQGTARDLLANALINAANAGYDTVFHVHDEIICEVPNGYGSVDELCKLMCIKPEWGTDFRLMLTVLNVSIIKRNNKNAKENKFKGVRL